MERKMTVPIWKKYSLTILEACEYFNICEKKLRSIVAENPRADYVLHNGNKILIKREMFEKSLDKMNVL